VKDEKFCDGCGNKGAIHVANRCSDELHRVPAERHSRHDRRYPASLRPVSCPAQETHSGFWRRQPILERRSAAAAEERGTQAWGVRAACRCDKLFSKMPELADDVTFIRYVVTSLAGSAQHLYLRTPYSILVRTLFECSHSGHSKLCVSDPGRSGSIRASSMAEPHLGHSGRIIALECAVEGRKRVIVPSREGPGGMIARARGGVECPLT
jgi:hypothetical protein